MGRCQSKERVIVYLEEELMVELASVSQAYHIKAEWNTEGNNEFYYSGYKYK
jgi:hypothetical protein